MPVNPGERFPTSVPTRLQAAASRHDRWLIAIAAFVLGVIFGVK